MRNKTAKILNILAIVVAVLYSVVGLLVIIGTTASVNDYSYYYYESSMIFVGVLIGASIVFIGILSCFVLKAIAEMLENSAEQTNYQREIYYMLLDKENGQSNYSNNRNRNTAHNLTKENYRNNFTDSDNLARDSYVNNTMNPNNISNQQNNDELPKL